MSLPVRSPFDLLIIALLIVFGGFLVFGFAFGKPSADGTRRQSIYTQLPQSLVLATCALIWWLAAARSTTLETFARLVFLGIALHFVSDIILADVLALQHPLRWGMVVCAAAAGFYILALRQLQILFALHDNSTLVIALVVAWVMSVGIWMGAMMIQNPLDDLVSLTCIVLKGSLAAYATALTIQLPALLPAAVGGVLSLVSAAILGNHLLHQNKWRMIGDVAWITYIAGQALIVFTNATTLTLVS